MRYWSVLVPADRYAAELLYSHETIGLHGPTGAHEIAEGDLVALVADVTPPVVFAIGTAIVIHLDDPDDPGPDQLPDVAELPLLLAYTHRLFDDPRPAADIAPPAGGVRELTAAAFARAAPVPANTRQTWLVSVDLPIEAETPAEAVRQFWTYVQELGPTELPAFVSPSDDELAMQAFVLGVEANLDPESD